MQRCGAYAKNRGYIVLLLLFDLVLPHHTYHLTVDIGLLPLQRRFYTAGQLDTGTGVVPLTADQAGLWTDGTCICEHPTKYTSQSTQKVSKPTTAENYCTTLPAPVRVQLCALLPLGVARLRTSMLACQRKNCRVWEGQVYCVSSLASSLRCERRVDHILESPPNSRTNQYY